MIAARLLRESFRAVGTDCAIAVTCGAGDTQRAQRALAAGRREIERCEQALSRFRTDSDLCRLNRGHGRWVAVDGRLAEALRAALRVRDATGGRYDPTILRVLEAAGYDRSFEELSRRPGRTLGDWRPGAAVDVDLRSGRARVEPGAAVDLGGTGKGFAAERAIGAMREVWFELPGALVDLGGDIVVSGTPAGGGPWRLAVADPRSAGGVLATLELDGGAVATSGRDQRRFGALRELHHLVDPAAGAVATAGPLSVSVVGGDAVEVEGFATALAITPIGEAAACLAARPLLSALLVPDVGTPIVLGDLPTHSEIPMLEVSA